MKKELANYNINELLCILVIETRESNIKNNNLIIEMKDEFNKMMLEMKNENKRVINEIKEMLKKQ